MKVWKAELYTSLNGRLEYTVITSIQTIQEVPVAGRAFCALLKWVV